MGLEQEREDDMSRYDNDRYEDRKFYSSMVCENKGAGKIKIYPKKGV